MGRYHRLCPEGLAIQGGSRPSLALTCALIWSPLKSVLSAGHKVWDRGYSEKTGCMKNLGKVMMSQWCVCACMRQGKHMQTYANVCTFTHYGQIKRTRANPLAVFFSLMISALLWSPWGSVQSLVSLQGMGRPRKVMFWGDLPGEAVSSLAAHFNPDLHGEETLPSAPRLQTSSAFLTLGHLPTKLHLVGHPGLLSCGSVQFSSVTQSCLSD